MPDKGEGKNINNILNNNQLQIYVKIFNNTKRT
jgi:hypothetical protein